MPSDVEELWAENVTTAEGLWRFVAEEQKVLRPWPGALLRADWKDGRSEDYMEEIAKGGISPPLVVVGESSTTGVTAEGDKSPEHKLPRLDVTYGDKLGSGAFGTVWQATDQLLERSVAVKFLTSTDEYLDENALIREARSLAKVAHPNLVTVYTAAWLRHPQTGLVAPAITMELLLGEELQKWWQTAHDRHKVLIVANGLL